MSSNPMMKQEVYQNVYTQGVPMTISGAINKTMLLLCLTVLTACYTWYLALSGYADKLNMIMITGLIGGFICAIVAAFKPQQSKILSFGYAAFEGLVLGGISAAFNAVYDGIVLQAVGITFACMFVMLILYKAGVIRATERFKGMVIGATVAIAVFYGIAILLSLFNNQFLMNVIYSSSLLGIGLNVLIAGIACLNFIMDFDFIEQGANMGAPKFMEWYGALSLLITLVWVYLEILRLLAKLNKRN